MSVSLLASVPGQSLAMGAAGTALLHVEQALQGTGTWGAAHSAIIRASEGSLDGSPRACLFYGAPALAFLLHAARSDGVARYPRAYRQALECAERVARQRLATAENRLACGVPGTFNEHDLVYGLTGLGALLLRAAPGSSVLADVLRYLVRLTCPLVIDGQEVPGWWSDRDPDPLLPTPGGHANLGMSHGAAGILALAALSVMRGIAVPGQRNAIQYLASWFGQWRQEGSDGPWWPQWLTRDDLRSGRPGQPGPGRPSWCYGTAGLARALQLAAIAVGGRPQQQEAEAALAACLSERQLARITGPGLCHGLAGIYVTAVRAAGDALTPAIERELPRVAALLAARPTATGNPGLLTGDAGTRLALEAARRSSPPLSGWDACLLIT